MAHARSPMPPSSMTVIDTGKKKNDKLEPRHSSSKKKYSLSRESSSCSLEILPPEEGDTTSFQNSSHSRPSSSGSRPVSSNSHRPDSSLRRSVTPSKQVSLQTVKRKDARHSAVQVAAKEKTSPSVKSTLDEEKNRGSSESKLNKDIIEDSDEFDTDLEDGSEDSGTEEEEPIKAPNELLMEFVTCMMDEDYENAKKLCTMILLYEPENPEALKFKPLIEEKIKLQEELAAQSSEEEDSGDDDDDSDEDDEDDDDNDDSESDSDSVSDDSQDNFPREDSDVQLYYNADSGVSSATEFS